ncbi:unnamed protein product [Dicrocoelium dendriticum]|nr:unnamed protein product [Dicrocoelium dendriticum]
MEIVADAFCKVSMAPPVINLIKEYNICRLSLNSSSASFYLRDISKKIAECRESKKPVLDLSNEELPQLQNNVFEDLPWITELYLYNNKLTSLPPSIGHLTNLQHLLMQQNMLTKLPKELSNLTHLKQLDLRHNRLEGNLPPCISGLCSLESLLLRYNKLTSIYGIQGLKNLTCLVICHNSLKQEIPETVGELTHLTTLDLSHNQITSLPESIGKCKSLRSLNLQHNQLRHLPDSIGCMQNLCKLTLKRRRNEDPQLHFPPSTLTMAAISSLCNRSLSRG